MIAVIHLPLWTVPATVVVLCFAPDCARWLRKRRVGEARRLRALNELWTDEVTERESSELETVRARSGTLQTCRRPAVSVNVPDGTGDNARSRSVTSLVSPRSAATDAAGFGDAA